MHVTQTSGEGQNLDADHEAKQIIVNRKGQTNSLLHRLLLLLERSLEHHQTQNLARVNVHHTMAATSRVQAARETGSELGFSRRKHARGSREAGRRADGARRRCA